MIEDVQFGRGRGHGAKGLGGEGGMWPWSSVLGARGLGAFEALVLGTWYLVFGAWGPFVLGAWSLGALVLGAWCMGASGV